MATTTRNPTKYPPEMDEAIWALMCEGVRHSEIRRRLASGEAVPGHELDPPRRTYFDHVAKLKEQRGEPRMAVRDGEEVSAAEAIGRRSLEMLRQELADLEAKQKAGRENAAHGLTERDLGKLRQIERTAADIARRKADTGREKRFGDKARQKADKTAAEPESLLARLAKQRKT